MYIKYKLKPNKKQTDAQAGKVCCLCAQLIRFAFQMPLQLNRICIDSKKKRSKIALADRMRETSTTDEMNSIDSFRPCECGDVKWHAQRAFMNTSPSGNHSIFPYNRSEYNAGNRLTRQLVETFSMRPEILMHSIHSGHMTETKRRKKAYKMATIAQH